MDPGRRIPPPAGRVWFPGLPRARRGTLREVVRQPIEVRIRIVPAELLDRLSDASVQLRSLFEAQLRVHGFLNQGVHEAVLEPG